MKAKKLREALQQLAEEGVVQLFRRMTARRRHRRRRRPLQLDVLKERMEAEYSLPVDFEPCQFAIARWISSEDKAALQKFTAAKPSSMADDLDGDPVFMASSQFTLKYDAERAPEISFSDVKDYQKVSGG
jgi:peptide chain release factor 3